MWNLLLCIEIFFCMMVAPHICSRKRCTMSISIPGNQKHLTLDNRIFIEKELEQGASFWSIARSLSKDPTMISKEIKLHKTSQPHNTFNEPKSKCALFLTCKKKKLCTDQTPMCSKQCKYCRFCNSRCKDFSPKDYTCLSTTTQWKHLTCVWLRANISFSRLTY